MVQFHLSCFFDNLSSISFNQDNNIKKLPHRKQNNIEEKETRIYGPSAVMSLFLNRPKDIIKVYLLKELTLDFADLIKFCVQNKLAYKVVDKDDLYHLGKTEHHGGILVLAKAKKVFSFNKTNFEKIAKCSLIVALEEVGNPHNLGAIVRSLAYFNVDALLINEGPSILSGAAFRTAQGGMEWVPIFTYDNKSQAIELLKSAHFRIVVTDTHKGTSLYERPLPKKVVLWFGSEEFGVSKDLFKLSDEIVRIPGNENMDSLNVATAVAVFLSEFRRSHGFGDR